VTWYTFFKSLHVVGAVIWLGGAAALQILAFRIIRTGDATRQAEFAKDAEFVGTRAFIPASWRSRCRSSSAPAFSAQRVAASPR
jgi:uncharacterized membrane protein